MKPAPLDRKVLRDLWRTKWQVLAIALLIACGVAVAVMALSAQRSISRARAQFYAETAFADVFATAKRAPLSLVGRLAHIDGVTAVDVRINQAGLMAVPGLSRPATVQVISLPTEATSALNRIRLTKGRLPDPSRPDEVVALKTFLEAAHLSLGDRLSAVVAGRSFTFTIVGAALSPEYVYVPAPESFMPDDAHRAVLWLPRDAAERIAGMSGAFNSASIKLAAGASEPQAIKSLNDILAPYGGRAALGRADQPSHAFLEAELKELSTSAAILPPVFLIIAAALVHLVLSRTVEAEREQIGLLRAFGYRARDAAAPYLKTAFVVGLVGCVAGGMAGAAFGAAIVDQYRNYFRFPDLTAGFHWLAFAISSAVALAAAMLGSAAAVARAAGMSPAVAMLPPVPTSFRPGIVDRALERLSVDQATRTIVRRIQRFPARTAFSILGLAASLSLLLGTQFLFDSLDGVIDQAYFNTQRSTHTVAFQEPRGMEAIQDLRRRPGVIAAEPVRNVAVRLRANGREEMTRLVGVDPDATLLRPLNAAQEPVAMPGGLVLSEALAGRLGVTPGDQVWAEVIDGSAPKIELPVGSLARDYSGFSAYMPRRALNRLMGEGDVADTANLMIAADAGPAFYQALEGTPFVIGASSRDETVRAWRQAMAEAFRVNISFYVGFAGAIAFGVAYNIVRITLSERARDLATLHVLGFSHADCAYVLGGELMIMALAATPIGLLGGRALAFGLVAAYSRDEVRLPALISAQSHAIALAVYIGAVIVAAVIVLRRLWTLDLVAVLKTRE